MPSAKVDDIKGTIKMPVGCTMPELINWLKVPPAQISLYWLDYFQI
jgi:hypothetical protein